jgi:hypothetical protein
MKKMEQKNKAKLEAKNLEKQKRRRQTRYCKLYITPPLKTLFILKFGTKFDTRLLVITTINSCHLTTLITGHKK